MADSRGGVVAVLAVAVLIGLAVIALPSRDVRPPAPSPTAPPSPEPRTGADTLIAARTAAVTALLARRADAVRRHDRAEFLADVDPLADARFRTAQLALIANLDGDPMPAPTTGVGGNPARNGPPDDSARSSGPSTAPTGRPRGNTPPVPPSPRSAAPPTSPIPGQRAVVPATVAPGPPPTTLPPPSSPLAPPPVTPDPPSTTADPPSTTADVPSTAGIALDDWSYDLDPADALPPPEPAAQPTPPDELWAPAVSLHYALTGGDTVPTTRRLGYLFARRGDRWYLTSDDQLDNQGRTTWRGPWDYGPCQERRTGRAVVISHPGAESTADRVARELDAAVATVTDVWGPDWPQRVTVEIPAGLPELRSTVGSRFATDGIAAVTVADQVDHLAHTVTGARVVLNPDAVAALSDTALRVVLRHEVTHVAARGTTVDGSPMWLLEGFADYVGYRDSGMSPQYAAPDLAQLVRTTGPPPDFPANADFLSGGDKLGLAYQLSWSVARSVAERFGEPALLALYRQVATLGTSDPPEVDAAFRTALGIDRRTFIHYWQDDLRTAF